MARPRLLQLICLVLALSLVESAGGLTQNSVPRPRALGAANETLDTAIAEAEAARRESDMRVSLSAVGFNIRESSSAAAELRETAEAGGGVYVAAARDADLSAALEQAVTGAVVAGGPGSVAIIPPPVFQGAPANGDRIHALLRSELARAGLRPLSSPTVVAALRAAGMKPAIPQPVRALVALGKSLDAEYVLYPRVLGVGQPLGIAEDDEYVINVLVNVIHVPSGRLRYTYQASAAFKKSKADKRALVPEAVARTAVARMLRGFLVKLKAVPTP